MEKLSESKIQSTCVIWLWNEHPETRGCFFAVKNEGAKLSVKRVLFFIGSITKSINNPRLISSICQKFKSEIKKGNSINGAIDKSMGVVPGVSDILFFWKGQLYCCEFKTSIGRQSDAQKKWQKTIESQGGIYKVIRSVDEFKKSVYKIFSETEN